MSAIALLAVSGKATPPATNPVLYATLATVIPVLFLALAVQDAEGRDTVFRLLTSAAASAAGRAGRRNPGGMP